jgi:transposase
MTARRYELTDFEWSIIEPLLPNKPRGVPWADDRRVLNGIYWRLRTGSPWADIPERYGPGHDLRQPLPALGQNRRLGTGFSRPSQKLMTAICR